MRIFLLLFFWLSLSTLVLDQDNDFSIMSFNIRYPSPDDGVNW
ncbi:MAG: hypothetical protein AAF806_09815 [Bacteroidota bacterium]